MPKKDDEGVNSRSSESRCGLSWDRKRAEKPLPLPPAFASHSGQKGDFL